MRIASSGTLLLRAGPRFSRPTASPAPPLHSSHHFNRPTTSTAPTAPPAVRWHWSPPSGAPLRPPPALDAPLEPFGRRKRVPTQPHAGSSALPSPHVRGSHSPIVRSCAWLSLAPRAACCLRRHPPRRARRRRSRTYCCFAHGRCSRLKRRQDRIAHLMLRWNLSGATEGP